MPELWCLKIMLVGVYFPRGCFRAFNPAIYLYKLSLTVKNNVLNVCLTAIHQLLLGSDCRTWDLVTYTQISCFDDDSTEGELQVELMKQWKKDREQPSIQQPYGKAWCSKDSAVVYWNEGARGSYVPDPQRPAVYLMPPIRVYEDEVSKQEHRVSFFGDVGGGKIGVLRYELLI
jgi:hypothetical protein